MYNSDGKRIFPRIIPLISKLIIFICAVGRGGVTPQTTPNLSRSNVFSKQIQSLGNTEVMGLQSSSLYCQGKVQVIADHERRE